MRLPPSPAQTEPLPLRTLALHMPYLPTPSPTKAKTHLSSWRHPGPHLRVLHRGSPHPRVLHNGRPCDPEDVDAILDGAITRHREAGSRWGDTLSRSWIHARGAKLWSRGSAEGYKRPTMEVDNTSRACLSGIKRMGSEAEGLCYVGLVWLGRVIYRGEEVTPTVILLHLSFSGRFGDGLGSG